MIDGAAHGFWGKSSRISSVKWLTNIEGRAGRARLYWATDGLGGLIDRFRQGGLEDIIQSWIGTGPNKPVSPNQLHQALGAQTVDSLSVETGLPRDDLLAQLSRALPEVIDKLTPEGKLPKETDLLPGPEEEVAERR